ncbi:peptide deformylase [bacterium (Candidatus Blackallbacteria) CG17_big_fil_post_rev_8_21_14_2_50_48_46]|uniref:Peptide deformylase n=1 Tax=bacterium (Candidatus Blackallbacteria) CG17_big_fil_post_rev_8_21_14_2_50_48_46 TaxID=2014261 RepID=A0A2M7G410_9BACT|nr:MAG: peptide deformylase [bacterium (Candidatus Blackallbacteria) CG18_big_fil_WC_8_21_14_2_50_49_26]PIW16230.1 MAG: peptide deformylase [bacterium (Candidatus Blackallbacteria) CG17_big_fil_post_rev_8_21_14_2_50_48_46]PIW49887.1 MAG: peptide deformylase [bacterium (Candidatus Blackallbacteria) CG13_big_fil_rev_8_21_14_2_50_49_14]
MAILDLKYYGSSVLTRPAKPIKRIDRELIKLAEDMLESMYYYHGVGLAAPQVGVSKRFVIVDCGDEYQDKPYFLVNPEVVSTEGEQIGPEGCLSLPDLQTDVKRPEKAVIRAMNLQGETITVTGEGLLARALLHEIDHLNGVLFTEWVEDEFVLQREIPLLKDRIHKILIGELPAVHEYEEDEEEAAVALA